jgi:hypothetical protein
VFKGDLEDIKQAKEWLVQKGILVGTSFGSQRGKQPLLIHNNPQARAVICFGDPD